MDQDQKMNQDPNQDPMDLILENLSMDDSMERKIDEFSKNKKRNQRIQRARADSARFQETYAPGRKTESQEEKAINSGQPAAQPAADRAYTSDSGATMVHQPLTSSSNQPLEDVGGSTLVQSPVHSVKNLQATQSVRLQDMKQMTPMGSSMEQTIVQSPVTGKAAGGMTKVFPAGKEASASRPQQMEGTRLIRDEELASYPASGQENIPELKREYVSSSRSYKPARHFSWKIPLMVLILVLMGIICVSAYQLANNWMAGVQTSTQDKTQAYFDELMKWAQSYDTLSDSQKKSITRFESMYNRLSEEKKREIDNVLISLTGKNFNELLAAASSGDKQDAGNNNTEIAEEKARLREQIEEKKAEAENLKNQMSYNQGLIDSAFMDLTSKTSVQQSAKANYDQAAVRVDSINGEIGGLQNEAGSIQTQLDAAKAKLDSLQNSSDGSSEENSSSIQAAKAEVEALESQMAANKTAQEQKNADLQDALQSLNALKTEMDNASQAVINAQNNYDAVKNSNAELQAQLDQLNSEITQLTDQLNRL